MVEQFLNHIHRHQLCKTTDKILLAVSGGLDSMVMLYLFLKNGFKIAVAHCNFQLRGDASDADEFFITEYCKRNNIPIHIKRFETTSFAENRKLSIQMAARELRYDFFSELATKENFHWIATAHHLNDSLETLLLQLSKGTSHQLNGISVKHGMRIRPLLFATRNQLESFASEHNITWREDESNSTDDYQRNFIRHQVIPKLKEINPSLEDTFRHTSEQRDGAQAFLLDNLQRWKSDVYKESDDLGFVDLKLLSKSPSPAYLLYHIVKSLGFNFVQCISVLQASSTGNVAESASHKITVDRNELIISQIKDDSFSLFFGQDERTIQANGISLEQLKADVNIDFPKNPFIAMVDAEKIKYPLEWRTWKPGDRFMPLGMTQFKKISDFLIDLKVPGPLKDRVTILSSGGEIVWVVGYRIDERFKITSRTKKVMRFELQQKAS